MRLFLLHAHWSDPRTNDRLLRKWTTTESAAATDPKPVIVPDGDILGIEKLPTEKDENGDSSFYHASEMSH